MIPMQRTDDIVGYSFQAEILCPGCTLDAIPGARKLYHQLNDVEAALSELCPADYGDLSSYDSGDYPKPVFRDQAEPGEVCAGCEGEI